MPELAGSLFLILAAVTIGYIATCAIWPFGYCRRCHGSGKRRGPLGRVFRDCRRCDGTGRRLRIGRQIWNELRRIHHDAHH